MANLYDQATQRQKWDQTIEQVQKMGYPQNPVQPPAFTSPQPRRPTSLGDAAAATSNPGVTQLPPSATQGSAPGPSQLYMQDRTDELRTQVGAGNYAQAAGTAARTAVQGLGMYGIELADKLATPAINAAASFGRGVMGADSQAAPTTTPATTLASAVPGAPPQAAPTAPNPTDQRLAAGTQTAPPTAPALPTTSAPAPSAQPAGNEIAPGVYNHGRGQYSDNAKGMNMPAVPGSGGQGSPVGKTVEQAQREGLVGERVGYNPAYDQRLNGATGISAQNMAAADALAGRSQQESMNRVTARGMGSLAQSVSAPTVPNSSNDWAARNNLRNMEVSAKSITANGGRFDQSGRGDSPEVSAYKAALTNDHALQQAQPGLAAVAMRENAGIQREGMQQQGANTRSLGQIALEQQKINQAGESQGFANRAAGRLEALQTAYQTAKTPEERSTLAQQIREIQGRNDPAEWGVQVTPTTKNIDGSTSMGSIVRYNKATGQTEVVQQPGQGGQSPYPDGQVLTGKDGKTYVVKNGVPVLK